MGKELGSRELGCSLMEPREGLFVAEAMGVRMGQYKSRRPGTNPGLYFLICKLEAVGPNLPAL